MAEGAKRPSPMKIASPSERQLVKQLHEEQQELNRAVSAPMKIASTIAKQLHEEQQERSQLAKQLREEQQERRQLAKRLHEEQQERNKAVSTLGARLEEVDQQIQVLQAQSQERQLQAIAPSTLHARLEEVDQQIQVLQAESQERQLQAIAPSALHDPAQDPKSALVQENLVAPASASGNTGSMLKEMVEVLMEVHNAGTSMAGTASSSTGSFLEDPHASLAASLVALQTGLKDLDAKQEQLTKELSSITALQSSFEFLDAKHEQLAKGLSAVKPMLKELDINVNLSAIRASRIALQSASLSMDERSQALAALNKSESDFLNKKGVSAGSAVGHNSNLM